MRRWVLALCAIAMLAACGAEPVWAPDEAVERARYRHTGPPRLTLFTMVSNETGSGAHSSLMVNASQRVIFDPAGSFKHETIPERNDVLFGITPQVADVYTRYHARETFHVIVQDLDVTPELAERALQTVLAYGAVPQAHCANSTSAILKNLPGFEHVRSTYSPKKLSKDFGVVAGVRTRELYEYDSDDNSKVLREWVPEPERR